MAVLEAVFDGILYLFPVEAVMKIEARVFGCDNCVLECRRYARQGHEPIFLRVVPPMQQCPGAALDLDRRRERIDPAQSHEADRRGRVCGERGDE